MIVVGDKEVESESGALRTRKYGDLGSLHIDKIIEKLLSFDK